MDFIAFFAEELLDKRVSAVDLFEWRGHHLHMSHPEGIAVYILHWYDVVAISFYIVFRQRLV